MRKLVSSFAALLTVVAFTHSSQAQMSYVPSTTWFGVRGGVTLGSESFDPALPEYITTGMKVGALGGLQVDHWFGSMWALSVQALYDQKGIKETFTSSVSNGQYDGEVNTTLSYLEIPILAKVGFGDDDFKPYVFAGPSIGLLLSRKSTSTVTPTNAAFESTKKEDFQSTDISAYFGAGFLYKITNGNEILFDAGYAAGLGNINKSEISGNSGTIKSGDIRLAIGMLWNI